MLLDHRELPEDEVGAPVDVAPAPIVRTTSPGRARRARKRAPSSTDGVQPIVILIGLGERVDDEACR